MAAMDGSLEVSSAKAPSIVLMGMRGAGKTTLGRLAAEHLDTQFIDADALFEERHAKPKDFVAQYGWPAFRRAETEILGELLQQIQQRKEEGHKPLVISLGGGVVEENVNRDMLKACWGKQLVDGSPTVNLDREKKVAVVHVFREVDKVLLDKRGLPSWAGAATNGGQDIWQRRQPWFRECSSHEFVNFTESDVLSAELNDSQVESSRAARLRFEAVERDFVRFLQYVVLAAYTPTAQPYVPSSHERSYLVTLPFSDLRPHVSQLPLITLGTDAVELRADLLSDPLHERQDHDGKPDAYEPISPSYLSEQVALIRRHLLGYPLVFTLRTTAQGGRYPCGSDTPSEALFASLRHALKLGCDVIDIEMGLDEELTRALIQEAKERRIAVLISWRDRLTPSRGGFHWKTERARQLYDHAVDMGADIVKIVGTAEKVSDNFALRVFAASLEEENGDDVRCLHRTPLSAYNMGYPGRISRFLNSTLASVTHPIAKELSKRGVVGNPSMTFEEIQKALHLSGLLERQSFFIVDEKDGESKPSLRLADNLPSWFDVMGLPFTLQMGPWPSAGLPKLLLDNDPRRGDIEGVCFPNGAHVSSMSNISGETHEHVAQTSFFDCITIKDAKDLELSLSNKIVEALVDLIASSISPSIHLNRSSACFILTQTHENTAEDIFLASSIQAARTIGLGTIVAHALGASDEAVRPTIVINCRPLVSSSPVDESLFSNSEGGLYLDLFDDKSVQTLLSQAKYKQVGWRCIDQATFWRKVDALRFQAFTGRRAPAA